MKKLNKEEQEKLAWEFYEDAGLRFVYPDFKSFVEARVGPYVTESDLNSTINTPIGGN